MKIINNVLTNQEFLKIEDTFTSDFFPWFITKGILVGQDNYQFTHIFYQNFLINSNQFELIKPIIKILNPSAIIKIKGNLLTKAEKIIEHGMHTDVKIENSKTAVYYVNTNNGYTKFKNGKKINSQANTLVIFNSNIEHTGTTCTDKDYRIILNFNYYE
jgi:hypothetical protein